MKKITHRSMVWLGMWAAASMSSAFANTAPCQGQIVYANNGSNLVGEVTALYGEKAEIRWISVNGEDYSGNPGYWDVSSLSVETDCSDRICKGATIYANNGSNLVGKVNRVFENGKAEIIWTKVNGESYSSNTKGYWDTSSLSAQTHCSEDRICEGNVIYANNGSNLVGTVHRVFANGKAEIKWSRVNGETYSSDTSGYWDTSSLSRESHCSGAICEGDEIYANNGSNLVGVAQRVFRNGKVEIQWTEVNGEPYSSDSYGYWDSSDLQKRSGPCGNYACHR